MDRVLFAGLQILSVLSFTAHVSSSRPHIIFILADDLVNMTLISFYLYVKVNRLKKVCVRSLDYSCSLYFLSTFKFCSCYFFNTCEWSCFLSRKKDLM